MDADLDTLATALYVTTDDLLEAHPERVPPRPRVGIAPETSDAEMLTLAVMQALLGFTSEARWLRYARAHLMAMFPRLPQSVGIQQAAAETGHDDVLAGGCLGAQTSIAADDVWVVDSTPVECARTRETVRRSELAGWAEYGYCASHSRFFWGLRLHLVCTLHGLPVGWALSGAKADERDVLATLLQTTPEPRPRACRPAAPPDRDRRQELLRTHVRSRPRRQGIELLRPARKGESPRSGERFFKPLRQVIESINDTLKGQLDLEPNGGRTIAGVCARVAQRVLALTAADLAQRPTRPNRPTLTDRLRPLRPLGLDHLVAEVAA